MSVETLREWFAQFEEATGERPTHIVLGEFAEWYPERTSVWALPAGLIAFADVPDAVLDRAFDASYGGTESPDFCAWSENWVLFSDQYDGSEGIVWVPRHPVAHDPIRPGGG